MTCVVAAYNLICSADLTQAGQRYAVAQVIAQRNSSSEAKIVDAHCS
jgi:hypothetical protein